jgi:hypothetical protein
LKEEFFKISRTWFHLLANYREKMILPTRETKEDGLALEPAREILKNSPAIFNLVS